LFAESITQTGQYGNDLSITRYLRMVIDPSTLVVLTGTVSINHKSKQKKMYQTDI